MAGCWKAGSRGSVLARNLQGHRQKSNLSTGKGMKYENSRDKQVSRTSTRKVDAQTKWGVAPLCRAEKDLNQCLNTQLISLATGV